MKNKHIYTIDLFLIVGTLITLITLFGYATPLVISPINNLTTTKSNILFSIENAQKLIIDDNINFTTPEEYDLYEGLKLNLSPGIYYWKAVGLTHSEIRTLTVESTVILELIENNNSFNVINKGNTVLDVEVYNNSKLIENIELSPSKESNFSGNKLIGRAKK